MSREFLPSTGSGVVTCEPSTRPDAVEAEAVVVFMSEGAPARARPPSSTPPPAASSAGWPPAASSPAAATSAFPCWQPRGCGPASSSWSGSASGRT
jgi:hypothetical protein